MSHTRPLVNGAEPTRWFRARHLAAACFTLALIILPTASWGQVPPRFYWKSLVGGNGIPLIYQSLSGNANPLDPAHVVSADLEFDAEVLVVGYARQMALFDRAATVAVLQTVGRVDAVTTVAGRTIPQHTNGYGDPMVEVVLNLVGPKPIKTIPDMMRYEPGFSLDLLVDLIVPIGEYDENSALNLGQNRWYGRVGAPIVWQLGPWVPGKRTTLELLPSVWIYGENDEFQGSTLETDPKIQIEGHLTRDFTSTMWGSLDANWMSGGASTLAGHTGDSQDSLSAGFTVGYHLNEKLQLTVGYQASISDSGPDDLRNDGFSVSLLYGWHKIVEGIERLGGE